MASATNYARRLGRGLFSRLCRPYVLRRIRRASRARLFGRSLVTDPNVFHPVHFRSTRLLVDEVRKLDLAGKRFLDMGTGSGAIGLFAALGDAVVTACDVNPHAVELARTNLRRHRIAAEVLESDLFSALGGRRFDVICFNIPFYRGQPRTPFEAAFFAGDELGTVDAFIAACPGHLAAGGAVLVIFSEDVDRRHIVAAFAAAGFAVAHERIAHRWFERFHLVRFQRVILPRSAA